MARQLPPSPKASSQNSSKVMKANKAKGSNPELALREFLFNNGFKGYRLNWKKVPGSPDVCYPGQKLAIFVNGCFWHRCKKCKTSLPKTNTDFWIKKFELNVKRDAIKIEELEKLGWKVLVIWECDIELKDFSQVVEFLNQSKQV